MSKNVRFLIAVKPVLSGAHSNWTQAQALIGFDFFLLILSCTNLYQADISIVFITLLGGTVCLYENLRRHGPLEIIGGRGKKIPRTIFFFRHTFLRDFFLPMHEFFVVFQKQLHFLKTLDVFMILL